MRLDVLLHARRLQMNAMEALIPSIHGHSTHTEIWLTVAMDCTLDKHAGRSTILVIPMAWTAKLLRRHDSLEEHAGQLELSGVQSGRYVIQAIVDRSISRYQCMH
jgi:hypothetical protein